MEERIILTVDGDVKVVELENYVKAKTLSLIEFGYPDLTFDEVREQARKVLDGDDLNVIGMFMQDEIKREADNGMDKR